MGGGRQRGGGPWIFWCSPGRPLAGGRRYANDAFSAAGFIAKAMCCYVHTYSPKSFCRDERSRCRKTASTNTPSSVNHSPGGKRDTKRKGARTEVAKHELVSLASQDALAPVAAPRVLYIDRVRRRHKDGPAIVRLLVRRGRFRERARKHLETLRLDLRAVSAWHTSRATYAVGKHLARPGEHKRANKV